jgi:predicted ester cyclase
MVLDDNKAIVRRVIEEVMNHGNVALVDQLFASTYVTTPLWPDPRRPRSMTGVPEIQAFRQGIAMTRAAFPDIRISIDEMIAEGDTVMVCTTTRGTHTGGDFFESPPTGKAVQWTTFSIYRLADGKIVEDRWLWDRLGVWQQLGVLPGQDALQQQRSKA